jgi:hypothetical protein
MANTRILIDAPVQVTHHERGRRLSIADRLQAAFGAFVAPARLTDAKPASNDNSHAWPGDSASLADPLALPPDWHGGSDLLSLSFLPFDR